MENTILIEMQMEKQVTNTKSLPFGKTPTDHMFVAEYKDGEWQNAKIVPFQNLTLSPLALCLHYGQTVFEGMKAFQNAEGGINIFRMEKHHDRFNKSLHRMCMPAVPKSLFFEAVSQLIRLDADWMPDDADGSLYIRPFMIATEERIGVKVSDEYLFMVVATPAYQYYAKPLNVKIETSYIRSADGGTGTAKCGGNYGGAFYPTQLAREEGFDQVLWTDSVHNEFIEESGTMNAMFYINDTLITPVLSGTILDGVTRDSLLAIARHNGIKVEERQISYNELIKAFEEGSRVEAFGAGTAAVVAPIDTITIGHKAYKCYTQPDALMFSLANALYEIRKGYAPDMFNWNTEI